MLLYAKAFGIRLEIIIFILFALIVLLAVLLIMTFKKLLYMNRKYYTIMSGKKGLDLEEIVFTRFKEMDKVKSVTKKMSKEHKEAKAHVDSCYSKIGLKKYDAFNDMAGELSFSLAILNNNYSGVVINAMHTKEGCFTYAKEIIKGESFITLSEEEKEALKKAMTVEDEIALMTTPVDSDEYDI
ncbi:MAG: DUF4446 family protein [Eubacterium sp.]|nr:DUF4446 family protein [Eubacterium sp.]SEF68471.1 Protein of unknown function [Eubacterium ruminantium]